MESPRDIDRGLSRRFAWAVMTVLALSVAAYALVTGLFVSARPPFVAALFAEKTVRAYGHLLLGGIALGTGAFQFSRRLRIRHLGVHRLLGRIYVATVTVSGLSALLLAPVSDGGPTAHFGFGMLAVLWLGTTLLAFQTVLAGRIRLHREWMIRSYALCLAAVTLRIYLPIGIGLVGFDAAYPAISWLCWVPNLLVAEWLLIPRLRGS